MSTTDQSSPLETSSSLNSSELVSRFLAATPSYLYNVTPVQNNFFFSKLLRSFVEGKNDSIGSHNVNIRRRKRSWRDIRERPLELTSKEKTRYQLHPLTPTGLTQYYEHYDQLQRNQSEKEQQILLQCHQNLQEHQSPSSFVEIRSKRDDHHTKNVHKTISKDTKKNDDHSFQLRSNEAKQYITEKMVSDSPPVSLFSQNSRKIKLVELQNIENETNCLDYSFVGCCPKATVDNKLLSEQKYRFNLTTKHFLPNSPTRSEFQPLSNFSMSSIATPDFLSSSAWHSPYSLPQSYPAIDPLHFFIDLRVSGYIWDHKSSEKHILHRNKHYSAFNVPQIKEYNRPLNLTRDESTAIKSYNNNFKGTHQILKNLNETYKKIWNLENLSRNNATNENLNKFLNL